MEELVEKLKKVSRFTAESSSQSGQTGWEGSITGKVEVCERLPGQVLFYESSIFRTYENQCIEGTNVYRWTFKGQSLELEHLRLGEMHPVFLVRLLKRASGVYQSEKPHLCRSDRYHLKIELEELGFRMDWHIIKGGM